MILILITLCYTSICLSFYFHYKFIINNKNEDVKLYKNLYYNLDHLIDKSISRIDETYILLKGIEWIDIKSGDCICPQCGALKNNGHKENCELLEEINHQEYIINELSNEIFNRTYRY